MIVGRRGSWRSALMAVLVVTGAFVQPICPPCRRHRPLKVQIRNRQSRASSSTPTCPCGGTTPPPSAWPTYLEQRGRVRILGVMSDVRNPLAVAAIDAIDTAYGHPKISWVPSPVARPTRRRTATAMCWSRKLPHSIRSSTERPGGRQPLPPPPGRATQSHRHHHRHRRLHQPGWFGYVRSLAGFSPLNGWRSGRRPSRTAGDRGWPLSPTGATSDQPEAGHRFCSGRSSTEPIGPRRLPGSTDSPASRPKLVVGLCTTAPPNSPMRIVYESKVRIQTPRRRRLGWTDPALRHRRYTRSVFQAGTGWCCLSSTPQGGLSWRSRSQSPSRLLRPRQPISRPSTSKSTLSWTPHRRRSPLATG